MRVIQLVQDEEKKKKGEEFDVDKELEKELRKTKINIKKLL